MSDKDEALRLADALEMAPAHTLKDGTITLYLGGTVVADKAAACLRRQHAEIESLKAECDALRAENEHLRKTAHEHVSRVLYDAHTAELRAEADALRADAERYRWLREESAKSHDFYSNDAIWMVSRQQGGMGQNFFGNKIDAAIDAAREGDRDE